MNHPSPELGIQGPRVRADLIGMPRIYLCDDQREYRALLCAVLTANEGLDVVGEGGDGGFCREDARASDPDVVLLDVNMPGVNGLDAIPMLRESVPSATIIMLSTAREDDCESEALARGAHGFIQKPRNILDLPAMIRGKLEDIGIEL